jgi:hypothetical protein
MFSLPNGPQAVSHEIFANLPANTARIDPATLPTNPPVIDALIDGTSPVPDVLDAIGGDRAEAA